MADARPSLQEAMLADAVARLERLREGRFALHVRFSGLSGAYQREDYRRIATHSFTSRLAGLDGQLFTLGNGDLVFLGKTTAWRSLDEAVNRLRMLFGADPFVQFKDTDGLGGFVVWYQLEKDYPALVQTTRRLLEDAEGAVSAATPSGVVLHPEVDAEKLLAPVRPDLLARLEQALAKADVTNVVRRQTVCTLLENQPPQPLFEEIYVSIEDLQSVATPGVDLLSDCWLFQYLTQTLDRRVMSMLIRDGVNGSRPFSLNLNVSTVLSPEFTRFEQVITPQLRGRLVIEMNKLDVFSDMGAFLFARDYLREHGFRLCLDGLTHHTLPYYDRGRLGFDLIKIYWTPESIDNVRPEDKPPLRSIIMEAGQARTILCRCESARAIEMGRELGIVMFQGRHVEGLLTSQRLGLTRF